jgi:hypothetical protein
LRTLLLVDPQMNEPPTMSGRLVFVIAAGLALSGCCLDGNGCYIPPPTGTLTSWDGLGPLPKRHHAKLAKVQKTIDTVAPEDDSPSEEDLAKLRPYSKEWGAALDAMNRAADAKLKKKLIICRDCMPPEPDDQTGSIATK